MIKDDCIFCKLANGVIPTHTAYEDEDFRVFMDTAPAAKGHALIVPKQHMPNAIEADEKTLGKIMILAAKVAGAVKGYTGCDGVNILQNNGEAAGQTVFHLHMHVIPRYENDEVNFSYVQGSPSGEELEDAAVSIGKLL